MQILLDASAHPPLIAQSQAENLALVSNEAVFDSYGVLRIW